MSDIGIIISSHVADLAHGVYRMLKEAAPEVSITYAGGTDDDDIGSSFEKIQAAIEANESSHCLAFYDLGSAKMTMEMAIDMSDKKIELMDVSFIEGAYTAASLLSGGATYNNVMEQLAPLNIK
ncbi:dihydroxyacetone kinase phosphoryl donor subunit DhaM [Salisediminibacterium halotolerans]|uniref:dihydroxyacetone kinase phosphoryl donor subunit DhaM n=1 Tax=Salisediminibacterium halotolerans TaxID=517425 RepID=UPI000EB12DCC|nr:dihydroxyacetone kinase phosphoryl donor subunit DhaM [Salisediminibacterium halotolerans]RLJ69279.1 dihydroxyacetone kinase DhaM subunit [Actinophytocola xinjiangensis]RPE86986.1 dihydroxyacetone kinase DhaM subunit [Salisediminibacterium halotolerans]TWG32281.1 dihydroxyacetone kinase DhaM subunit [Salisediminibacterium halotolerans]GEL08933.1 PTS-dependent dihydroxyacetone kinase phosphotransferase subunit DhaM [Salisediminibacterium halotolerans]